MEYKELIPTVKWNCPTSQNRNILIMGHPDQIPFYFDGIKAFIWEKFPETTIWQFKKQISDVSHLSEEISQMDLTICFITNLLLFDDNSISYKQLSIIIENQYPLLPILDGNNLQELYKEKLGRIHYIKRKSGDVNYYREIEKFINNTNISNRKPYNYEITEDIFDAFTQSYFISYRRKDAEYVDYIQRLIHKEEIFFGTQLWYDSYEAPGKDYELYLKKIISNCSAVILLVTPNLLLDPDSYVLRIELPYARSCNKPIIPLLMEEIDLEDLEVLKKICNIPKIYKIEEWQSFEAILRNAHIPLPKKNEYPNHLIQIGKAYMYGYNVERNIDVACEVLYQASEFGYISAYDNLIKIKTGKLENEYLKNEEDTYSLYQSALDKIEAIMKNNPDCDDPEYLIDQFLQMTSQNENLQGKAYKYKDVDEAISLFIEKSKIIETLYQECPTKQSFINLFNCRREYGEFCLAEKRFNDAYNIFLLMYNSANNDGILIEQNKDTHLSVASLLIGNTLEEMGEFDKAEKYYRRAVDIDYSLNDGPHYSSHTFTNLLLSLRYLGDFLKDSKKEYLKAKIAFLEVLNVIENNSTFYSNDWDQYKVIRGDEDSKSAKIREESEQHALTSLLDIELYFLKTGYFNPKVKVVHRVHITDPRILQTCQEEEIKLLSHEIMINSISKIKWLVNFLNKIDLEFDVCQKNYCIDAKSLMGITSLNMLDTAELVVHSTNYDQAKELLHTITSEMNEIPLL